MSVTAGRPTPVQAVVGLIRVRRADIRKPIGGSRLVSEDGPLLGCRAIRAGAGPNAATPIIALTANAMQSDKDMCLQAGMNDFLTKPFNKEVLLACMQQHLARPLDAKLPTAGS